MSNSSNDRQVDRLCIAPDPQKKKKKQKKETILSRVNVDCEPDKGACISD